MTLTCGCEACNEMQLAGEPSVATQEDLLCDPCRDRVCAGWMQKDPEGSLLRTLVKLFGPDESA